VLAIGERDVSADLKSASNALKKHCEWIKSVDKDRGSQNETCVDLHISISKVRVADYRPAVNCVLSHYGLTPESLELVASVEDWRQENCIMDETDASASRPAICILKWAKTGVFHVVMRETLSRHTLAGIDCVLRHYGFDDEVRKLLTSDGLRLLHLLLHEIAGYVLNTLDQVPRDTWAFEEMDKHRSYFEGSMPIRSPIRPTQQYDGPHFPRDVAATLSQGRDAETGGPRFGRLSRQRSIGNIRLGLNPRF
jgi:hypothetical protein